MKWHARADPLAAQLQQGKRWDPVIQACSAVGKGAVLRRIIVSEGCEARPLGPLVQNSPQRARQVPAYVHSGCAETLVQDTMPSATFTPPADPANAPGSQARGKEAPFKARR